MHDVAVVVVVDFHQKGNSQGHRETRGKIVNENVINDGKGSLSVAISQTDKDVFDIMSNYVDLTEFKRI